MDIPSLHDHFEIGLIENEYDGLPGSMTKQNIALVSLDDVYVYRVVGRHLR